MTYKVNKTRRSEKQDYAAILLNDLAEPADSFRMGTPPAMVEIMPKISGVEFEEAWGRRVDVRIDNDFSASVISPVDQLVVKAFGGKHRI